MQKTITTSIRMPRALKRQLERKAAALKCGKNRVIVSALENFLAEDGRRGWVDEARRQSLLAAKLDARDENWERAGEADFAGS